jgi:hypothetical protein
MKQQLLDAAISGELKIVQQLIAKQADVNGRDYLCLTILMHAAYNGHAKIAHLLIASQADVNAQDRRNSYTPLIYAASHGHTNTVRALLDAQADLSMQDKWGRTALFIAQKYNKTEIIEIIKQESRVHEETAQLRETALVLCAIRAFEHNFILSLIPNELLFLILEQLAPDGYKRLLPQNQE